MFFIVLLVGGWYGFDALSKAPAAAPPAPLTYEQQVEQAKQGNAASLSPQAAEAAKQTAAAQFANIYQSPFGFSFGYPDSLKVGSSDDPASGATTITAQDTASHVGFQIVTTPWSDTDPITAERVLADLPDIAAHDFTPVMLDGTPGLAFGASDAFFGDSVQIWLVYRGYLYQVSTYATQGPLVSKVLGTWKWKD